MSFMQCRKTIIKPPAPTKLVLLNVGDTNAPIFKGYMHATNTHITIQESG